MSLAGAWSWTVAHAAYPVLLSSSIALVVVLVERGVPPVVATTIAFVVVLGLTLALERSRPHEIGWHPSRREARQDLAYLGLAAVLQPVARLLVSAPFALVALLGLQLVERLHLRPWLVGGATWARVLAALALADLGKYWLHRLAHEREGLWRFHAEHHAPSRMYALNGVRLHPVNLLWNLALDVGAPLLFGVDAAAAAPAMALRGAVAVLQHANVTLHTGPLDWIFSTPNLHQWHHSRLRTEADANYGSTFIVWDVLFGTRRLPSARRRPSSLGIAEPAPRPSTLVQQWLWPWRSARRRAGIGEV